MTGLNARKAGGGNSNTPRIEQPVLEAGGYPGRLAQVIDLGVQPQRPFKGEEKPPVHQIMITLELVDAFCVDEDGNEDEDKPRWMSEDFPLYNLQSERAKSTKRYYAFDPKEDCEGDWSQLLGFPVNVMVGTYIPKSGPNEGKERNKIQDLTAMRPRDAEKCEELKNPAKMFSLEEPDMEVFGSLPEWLQEKIKANLEYKGSALEELLEGGGEKPKAKKKEPEDVPEEVQDAINEDDDGDEKPW